MNKNTEELFLEFYNALENKNNIFYMFFSNHLLHWVNKAIQFVPTDINLILISAGLDQEDLTWVKKEINTPIFILDEYVSNNYILDMLLKNNNCNFGWIDIDCFILNPNLFHKLITIDKNHLLNCVWAFSCLNNKDIKLLNTYCIYFNIEAYHHIYNKTNIGPFPYAYNCTEKENADVHILSGHQENIMKKYFHNMEYPINTNAKECHSPNYFDTLIAYQLAGKEFGYDINHITKNNSWNYFSDVAIHIGASSQLNKLFNMNKTMLEHPKHKMLITLIYFLILQMQERNYMPSYYIQLKAKFEHKIKFETIDELKQEIYSFMSIYDLNKNIVNKIINTY